MNLVIKSAVRETWELHHVHILTHIMNMHHYFQLDASLQLFSTNNYHKCSTILISRNPKLRNQAGEFISRPPQCVGGPLVSAATTSEHAYKEFYARVPLTPSSAQVSKFGLFVHVLI